jgi:hypothetical protein
MLKSLKRKRIAENSSLKLGFRKALKIDRFELKAVLIVFVAESVVFRSPRTANSEL